MNSIQSFAVSLCCEKADTVRSIPPSEDTPGPSAPGRIATPNLSLTAESSALADVNT